MTAADDFYAIQQAIFRYGWCIDHRTFDELDGLFVAGAIVLNWLVGCLGYGIMRQKISAATEFADPTMGAGIEARGGSYASSLLELASCTCAFPTLVLVGLFIAGSVWSDPDDGSERAADGGV